MLFDTKTNRLVKVNTDKIPSPEKSGNGFYPQLDGLRFIFVFLVLPQHWGPRVFFEQYRAGWTGVDLFFVLSGFLIGEILLKEKSITVNRAVSIRNFFVRRILRIFPLYYLTILLYSIFISTGGIFIWNITYTNNIFQAFYLEHTPKEFWHLWSLCVEEQFYLFFPFLALYTRKKVFFAILVAGVILSVAGRLITTVFLNLPDPHVLMPFCLDSLFLGVLLAFLKAYKPELLLKILGSQFRSSFIAVLMLFALVCLCYLNNNVFVYGFLRLFGSVCGFFLIGYSAMKGFTGWFRLFLENSFISTLGKISYGIYLLHPFIEKLYYRYEEYNFVRRFLIAFDKPLISNRFVIDFFLLFSITIAFSYLSYRLFEKKFLKLKLLFT